MELAEADEHSYRAEQQRARRLAHRACGYCDEPAAAMLPWGRQKIAICTDCNAKLAGATPPVPYCAFYDVDPTDLLPQRRLAGLMLEARLLPAVEAAPAPRPRPRSLLGRILRAATSPFRSRASQDRRTTALPSNRD